MKALLNVYSKIMDVIDKILRVIVGIAMVVMVIVIFYQVILRYVFNQFDQPGRYLYLRDDDSGDFWSASWQPVGKDLAH